MSQIFIKNWIKGHISDLISSLDAGVSVNGFDRPKSNGELGVLKVSAVSYGAFDPTANKAVIPEDICRLKESPKRGHIIVSRSNSPGLVAANVLVGDDYPDLFLSDKLWQLKPKPGIELCIEWLANFMSSTPVRYKLSKLATGTSDSMKNISKDDLLSLKVDIPPYREQKEIARILGCSNRAIYLTELMISAQKERHKWLMQQILTGKRRLPGFEKSWKEVKISDIFKPVRRKNNKSITHVLTASGEHGLVDQTEYFNRSVAGESLEGYYLLRRGEFAYNRSSMNGYPYGAIKRLDAYDEGVLSTLYLCFELSADCCYSDFYKHFFEAGVHNEQLRSIVQVGARAHGLLNVTLHDFFALKVLCPPIEEQKKIASTIDIAERELDLLRSQLRDLKEQKRGLMQQLLTGKRRVKVQ